MQFVPIHFPLISSTVDFVCSFYQEYNYLSFTVWSPLRSELCAKFCLSRGCCSPHSTGVSLTESENRVCFCYCQFCQFCQFCQYSLLLSVWVCIVCVPPRCIQPTNNDTLSLLSQFIICAVNFCIFGLGITVSFLSSLEVLVVISPFETLVLNSCPFVGVKSFLLLEELPTRKFEGDDSIPTSELCSNLYLPCSITVCVLVIYQTQYGMRFFGSSDKSSLWKCIEELESASVHVLGSHTSFPG
jgi:hypothetical protein